MKKMEQIKLDISNVSNFVSLATIGDYKKQVLDANKALHEGTGEGNDFVGWVGLPSSITEEYLAEVEETAKKMQKNIDVLVVVGIGGSYLGAKAVIDSLSGSFDNFNAKNKNPRVIYAGINLSEDYLAELREFLKDKSYGICVISKSGTTTEPAIAFRILKNDIEEKFGKEDAKNRIVAITDAEKGALKIVADNEGYKTFVIPDNVGGRYSVLTPVGLIPIAIAGFDIRKIVEGAKLMEQNTSSDKEFENNIAGVYAATRNALYKRNYKTEILVNYNPKLQYMGEWWKQLFGESEGKNNKGIFPASANFTSDLHSLGQYIQEGERTLFETIISVKGTKYKLAIPENKEDHDKLNYLAGKNIEFVNEKAMLGTLQAHLDGGVPNIIVEIPELSEFYVGQLIYFFEKACGIGGYLLEVNPFDQPGVEAYKTNMFKLLGKE